MRTSRALLAAAAAAALALTAPAAASAAPPEQSDPEVWSTQLAAPFSLVVDGKRVLVADGGTGAVGQLQPDGSVVPIIEGVPGLAGLALRGGWTAHGSTVTDFGTFTNLESGLNIRSPQGETVYADLHAYEVANNPDGEVAYGVAGPSPCVEQAFAEVGIPASYTGLVDSHVYAVADRQGAWIVADAGANAVYSVTDSGAIETLAVLPPQPMQITADLAAMFGMPDCVIGVTYAFEAVPTGVAIGRGGEILVSTLPGGPELGARGALWSVDPETGAATQLAAGLAGPTSIASARDTVYVAELFGGRVSEVRDGAVSTVAELPGALAVATAANGTLWAATMGSEEPPAPGTIVSISNGKVKVIGHVNR